MAGKKKKPLDFMEMAPLDDEEEDEDEDLEELGDDEFEEDEDEELEEGDLDDEGLMLAETVLGDGDMETRAQALKDFVKHCMSQNESGEY